MQDVAIVGIGCRFPQADDYSEYWNNLMDHVNCVKPIGYDRWKNGRFGLRNDADLGWDNEQFVKYCASLDGIDEFDHAFFNLSPREVSSMDPQHRMLLEESWHCVEDSGIPLQQLRNEVTSVFVGITGNDYGLIALTGGAHVDNYAALGNFECLAANRISHFLGLSGESLSLDTACSSSLVAVHKAKQNLLAGDSKYAIAAGVCLSYHPWRYVAFSKSNMMSKDGQCKAFDANANGFVQGEGVGVLLLQRLEDAVRDGNHIYGVIKGTAVNHCGASQTIAAPNMKAQMDVVEKALKQSGVDAATVSYIETHGTGTALGDPIEVEALTQVFRKYTDDSQFCSLGSVKANIGHLASAAGVAGLIKVLLMMKHRKIPKLLNLKELNPLLQWERTPFTVARENTDWEPAAPDIPLRAGVSGFGFGGVNAHIIVEEYKQPVRKPAAGSAREGHIFALSALNAASLNASIPVWVKALETGVIHDGNLGDACKTLLAGRRDCSELRIAQVVRSTEELAEFLQSVHADPDAVQQEPQKWAFRFQNKRYDGYSQIKGVMDNPFVRSRLNEAVAQIHKTPTAQRTLLRAIRHGVWEESLAEAYSFLCNYSLARSLLELGVQPESVSGENQGSLLAMTLASMVKLPDVYMVLTGEADISGCGIARPLVPYTDSINGLRISRFHVTLSYVEESMRSLTMNEADNQAFAYYLEKARILSQTQFTYKKYLRDWDQALRSRNLSVNALLDEYDWTSARDAKTDRLAVLTLLITYGSLLKLNRKWELSEAFDLSDGRLRDLNALVLDDIVTKEMAVELFADDAVHMEGFREKLHARLNSAPSRAHYPFLSEANNQLAEAGDLAEWKKQIGERLQVRELPSAHMVQIMDGEQPAAGFSPDEDGIYSWNKLLAKLWTSGAELVWPSLYPPSSYARLPLAGYCFNRTSHWMELRAPSEDEAAVNGHPMVDRSKSRPEQGLFCKTLKVSDFYVGDHIVDGQVILPGVAYLEMVRAAGEAASGQPVLAVRDVMWVARMEIRDQLDAFIQISRRERHMDAEVYTLLNGERSVHCRAKLIPAEGAEGSRPERLDIEAVKGRCGPALDKEFIYGTVFRDYIGFDYGPGFQTTAEAFYGNGESLERLELPPALLDTFDQYVLHPSIIDAALRAVTWIGGPEAYKSLKLHIPFSLGEVRIYGRLTPECYSYATLAPETAANHSGTRRFHIRIVSGQGETLVEARNFTIRPIPGKSAGGSSPDAVHLYTEEWREAAALESGRAANLNVLYFGQDKGRLSLLEKALSSCGSAPARMVYAGKGQAYEAQAPMEYALRPGQVEDCRRMLENLRDKGIHIGSVLYDWDILRADETEGQGALQQRVADAYESIVSVFKAFTLVQPEERVSFVLAAPEFEALSEAGLLKGLSKAFLAYNRSFIPAVVHWQDEADLIGLAAAELSAPGRAYRETASRNGVRVHREVVPLEGGPEDRFPGFVRGGTYLITGGLGRLGTAVAEYALKTYEANVVLSGRSELDEAKRNELARLQAGPGHVLYMQGDAADKEFVGGMAAQARQRFGSLNGVIHCAGVLGEAPLMEADRAHTAKVLLPKIAGAAALDEATREDKLDFFVLFSSISSIIGDFARGAYAAANGFLDGFAVWRAGQVKAGLRSGASLSMNWPVWTDGAMQLSAEEAVQYHQQAGLDRLNTQDGLELLDRLVKTGLSRIIVACGDRQKTELLLGVASSPKPPVREPVMQPEEAVEDDYADLNEAARAYLTRLVAKATRLSPGQVDGAAEFSRYGIDSIMIMELNAMMEKDFEDLSKTLFFEYSTIHQLAGYLAAEHGDAVRRLGGVQIRKQLDMPDVRAEVAAAISPVRQAQPALIKAAAEEPQVKATSRDIAIVGLSGQYPMADTLEEFWEILKNGQDCTTEIPGNRWDSGKDFHPEKGRRNKVYCKWGAFLNDVDKFDAGFFHISPREAELMDPQERLMLQTAYHTLEDAGYAGSKLSGERVGVYVGVMNSHYQMLGAEQYAQGELMDVRSSFASMANRISYHFNFKGPSLAVDTMCSSALVAIHMACESIRAGECRMALAGSVNTIVHPAKYIFLSDQRFGSSEGKCRAFGKGGDGYVPGEGVGAVLLKPLEQAVLDGDQIYGVIKGTAVNHGGKVSSYTVPNPNAQAELIEEALVKSGVHPEQINYLEAHGTGTALGDPIEVAGLTKAFRRFTGKQSFCAIGSVKSNIGHLESAAGMASLTKVLLQMKHRQLVPSIHAEQLNENIDFGKTPFYVQRSLQAWEPPVDLSPDGQTVQPLRAGVSSFGAGGTNAHLIIEEYPQPLAPAAPGREQVLVLSAGSREKLMEQAGRLADFIASRRLNREAPAYAPDMAQAAYSREEIRSGCMQIVADTLGINADFIDWDEELSTLCADAVHRVGIVGQLKERYGIAKAESVFAKSQTLNEWLEACFSAECAPAEKAYDLDAEYSVSLEDMAYTLQIGREAFDERMAVVGSDLGQLADALARYAAGETNIPDVYVGNSGKSWQMQSLLFQNDPGKQFVGQILDSGHMRQIAQLWLLKVDFDWRRLYGNGVPQKITLPPYSFDKRSYWVGGKGLVKGAAARKEPAVLAPVHLPVEEAEAAINPGPHVPGGEAGVLKCLTEALQEVIYLDAGSMDTDRTFAEYGVNSVLTLEFVDKVNKRLGLALHTNDLFNYTTIKELAGYIGAQLSAKPYGGSGVSSGEAPADYVPPLSLPESDEIDFSELEALLEDK